MTSSVLVEPIHVFDLTIELHFINQNGSSTEIYLINLLETQLYHPLLHGDVSAVARHPATAATCLLQVTKYGTRGACIRFFPQSGALVIIGQCIGTPMRIRIAEIPHFLGINEYVADVCDGQFACDTAGYENPREK